MKVLLVSEGKHEEAGALEALVRRTAPQIHQCVWDRVSSNSIHTHRGKGQGFFKRAVRWMLEARDRGFDALILVVDEDGYRERVKELAQAQSEQTLTAGFPRALGIAIRSFDAWMLADEIALSAVLRQAVSTQPSPEDLADPKGRCAELLEMSGGVLSQRDFYSRLAIEINLTSLENRCPKGFGTFAPLLRTL